MKSNLSRIFFEWALIASVLMSVGFFAWYWITSHKVRGYESQIAAANEQFRRTDEIMQALGRDCAEYSKTNADFARFLASMSTPPPPAAASAKPKSPGTR